MIPHSSLLNVLEASQTDASPVFRPLPLTRITMPSHPFSFRHSYRQPYGFLPTKRVDVASPTYSTTLPPQPESEQLLYSKNQALGVPPQRQASHRQSRRQRQHASIERVIRQGEKSDEYLNPTLWRKRR